MLTLNFAAQPVQKFQDASTDLTLNQQKEILMTRRQRQNHRPLDRLELNQQRLRRRSRSQSEEEDDRPMTVQDGYKLGGDMVDLVFDFINFWRS